MIWLLLSIQLNLVVFKCFTTSGEEELEDVVGEDVVQEVHINNEAWGLENGFRFLFLLLHNLNFPNTQHKLDYNILNKYY